jgi:hypothetical protein
LIQTVQIFLDIVNDSICVLVKIWNFLNFFFLGRENIFPRFFFENFFLLIFNTCKDKMFRRQLRKIDLHILILTKELLHIGFVESHHSSNKSPQVLPFTQDTLAHSYFISWLDGANQNRLFVWIYATVCISPNVQHAC